MLRKLYYGDNLEVLQKQIRDETVDLCYIDPPFNSKRSYNQIYSNFGKEDVAQAQAFIDTWTWDKRAIEGFEAITRNARGIFPKQSIDLLLGLAKVLGKSSLLAYLVSMTQRIAEIHRVLKPTGSFYLHCDPTASHYLKLVLDAIFSGQGRKGAFRNELIWCYRKWNVKQAQFPSNHDVIFFYTKSDQYVFHTTYLPKSPKSSGKGKKIQSVLGADGRRKSIYLDEQSEGTPTPDWWEIPIINPMAKERLGYPTQKPEALLERILKTSSNVGDCVLDAFCGCGTTVAVAERLERSWIGIDITFQSISLIMKRLEDAFGKEILTKIALDGVPKDLESANALARKEDDRTRKEFEKWAILTYTENRGIINEKKGADGGIDGVAFIQEDAENQREVLFSVKSGRGISVKDVRELGYLVEREKAATGILLTLESPTKPMVQEAKKAGFYQNVFMRQPVAKLRIVTVAEILQGERFNLPLTLEVLKRAGPQKITDNLSLDI